MQSKDILTSGWDQAYDIEGWYPPIKMAMQDVDATQAMWRPPGHAGHSIFQLVTHLLYYKKRFLFRLERVEWPYKIETNDESFQAEWHSPPLAWDDLVQELSHVQSEIRKRIHDLNPDDLEVRLPEKEIGWQLLELIMHDAYHTGQIILMRKLHGSWPEIREV